MADPLLIAKGEHEISLLPRMANRHGLVAGATGTGKTVTLQVLAENFSRIGVPVFMADVKGDLSGISQPGTEKPRIAECIRQLGLTDFAYAGYPVTFWDVNGEQGHPVRATVSDLGPLLFSRLLDLNETQSGVLSLVFKVADDNGLLLLDFKDLRSMVQYVGDNADSFRTEYGQVSKASIGAIQRGLLALDEQGSEKLFGEPSLNLDDLMQTDNKRYGVINILAADKLMQSPKMYSTLLLWLLSELFERLPEVGDVEKPKLVFFFDEAHLLFTDAPEALQQKIEQVVRLIRSKGVGIYFVSQNPLDIPEMVLGQLGNRVQHALRAFTPRDQKAVRSAAQTFRPNPALNIEQVITELGVGEALVSFLDENGTPGITERAFILPPHSQIGPITPDQRKQLIQQSLVYGQYEKRVDRDSAYEMLKTRAEAAAGAREAEQAQKAAEKEAAAREKEAARAEREAAALQRRSQRTSTPRTSRSAQDPMTVLAKTAVNSVGKELARGLLGSLLGGKR